MIEKILKEDRFPNILPGISIGICIDKINELVDAVTQLQGFALGCGSRNESFQEQLKSLREDLDSHNHLGHIKEPPQPQIKPCPFCGQMAIRNPYDKNVMSIHHDSACIARDINMYENIEGWNRRV